ncbi:Syntaxin 6, N-terminal [Sesbania bispinosa]|nr:Syntaxin 6, N-terminal [Sesbania bispinosa]
MASSFDRWEKDPFFNAAEEVQESADRTWIHATKDASSMWNSDELYRDLHTALGTAKWQLEEFDQAVRSSYSKSSSEEAKNRHRDFIAAIEDKITEVEHLLNESNPPGSKASLPWVRFDEGEQNELALFLSGMPVAESNNPTWSNSRDSENSQLSDKDSVINCSKNFHVSSGWGEAKEEKSHGHRRTASASADIGSWNISVPDDAQQWSSSSGSSGPMHKVPSLSGFLSSMESVSKLKWPRKGYRKLKAVDHHKENDSALLPTDELNRGNNACIERSKSSLDSCDECYDKQLYGWYGAIQRQLQRSQYQMQYSQPVRITVWIVILLCLIGKLLI